MLGIVIKDTGSMMITVSLIFVLHNSVHMIHFKMHDVRLAVRMSSRCQGQLFDGFDRMLLLSSSSYENHFSEIDYAVQRL